MLVVKCSLSPLRYCTGIFSKLAMVDISWKCQPYELILRWILIMTDARISFNMAVVGLTYQPVPFIQNVGSIGKRNGIKVDHYTPFFRMVVYSDNTFSCVQYKVSSWQYDFPR